MNHTPSIEESGHLFFAPERVRTLVLAAVSAGSFYLCWLMIYPFLAVVTWSAALAILAYPAHAWLARKLRPNAAALVAVCFVALIVVVPVAFVSQKLVTELNATGRAVRAILNSPDLPVTLQQYPRLADLLEWLKTRLDLAPQIQAAAGAIAGMLSSWVGASVWVITQFVLTFMTLFYFFRDQARFLDFLRRFVPLSPAETDQIFRRIAQTIQASLYGNLLVKLIQGMLGGLIFWILGLPSPVLFGAAMALFAIVPVMGTALVWAPAVVFLAVTGSPVKAVILALAGVLLVGSIDNILYPLLVAGELRFHPLAAFFAVFGGLIVFGVAGVVLGPVTLAIAMALLEVWQVRSSNAILAAEE